MISHPLTPFALRTAKTLWSFGCSECNRVNYENLLDKMGCAAMGLFYLVS